MEYEIEFDPNKDRLNRRNHGGLSLADAERFDWETFKYVLDTRFDYDEERYQGFCGIGDTLYMIAFTFRGESRIRVISLRKATNREIEDYEHL